MSREKPQSSRPLTSLSGLLTAAGVVACAATVFGFLGRLSWFVDLFSHFRVQYLFGLLGVGLALLLMRRRVTASAFLIFACVNLGVVLPMYVGDRPAAPEGTGTLRAMLLNVNTHFGDAGRVRQVIEKAAPDILVLEEINSQWVRDLRWLAESHPHSCLRPREDNFGIGLFSAFPLVDSEIVVIGDADVPTVIATADTPQGRLALVGTHPVPPANAVYSRWRNDQLDKLPGHVNASGPVMLLGDLNATPWNHHFRKLLKRTGLLDSSRGRGIQPTWPSFNPLLRIPIDHILHSPDVAVRRRWVGDDVGSDHYPVIVDFVIRPASVRAHVTSTR